MSALEIQYDLFKSQEDVERDAMVKEIETTKEMANKVRKALFARHGELYKTVLDLSYRLEIIERNICKGKDYA